MTTIKNRPIRRIPLPIMEQLESSNFYYRGLVDFMRAKGCVEKLDDGEEYIALRDIDFYKDENEAVSWFYKIEMVLCWHNSNWGMEYPENRYLINEVKPNGQR